MVSFEESYKKGLEFENILLAYLRHSDPDAYTVSGKEIRFDIVCPNTRKTYEAKYDYRAKETDKFAIEIEHEGNPSGLPVSKADYWVLYDGEFAYMMATEALQEITRRSNFKIYSGEVEGKENKRLILIPRIALVNNPYVEILKL